MIELFISSKIRSNLELKLRVEDNNIALKLCDDNNIEYPRLIEGKKTYKGVKAINAFLDDFESFMHRWHTPKCDDYDFD